MKIFAIAEYGWSGRNYLNGNAQVIPNQCSILINISLHKSRWRWSTGSECINRNKTLSRIECLFIIKGSLTLPGEELLNTEGTGKPTHYHQQHSVELKCLKLCPAHANKYNTLSRRRYYRLHRWNLVSCRLCLSCLGGIHMRGITKTITNNYLNK